MKVYIPAGIYHTATKKLERQRKKLGLTIRKCHKFFVIEENIIINNNMNELVFSLNLTHSIDVIF